MMKAVLINAFDTNQERIWYLRKDLVFLKTAVGPRIPVKKRLRIDAQGNEVYRLVIALRY